MNVPLHILTMAIVQSNFARTRINIYHYHNTYVIIPEGYTTDADMTLKGYVRDGNYYSIEETDNDSKE